GQGAAGAGQRRDADRTTARSRLPRPCRQCREDRPAQRIARPAARDHGRERSEIAVTVAPDKKIVLIVRPTRLDDLVTRFNTVQQAQFYVEHLGADFSDYLIEHKHYRSAVQRAEDVLREFGRVQRLERRYVPNFVFGAEDGVVVLGQDGLVANTLKYLDGQRVVAINPDPARWNGVLLPFTINDLPRIMAE